MQHWFLYLLGLVLVASSLAYAAYLLGVGLEWIIVVTGFVVGSSLIGLAKSRRD